MSKETKNKKTDNFDVLNSVITELEGTQNFTKSNSPIQRYITFSASEKEAGFYTFDKDKGERISLGESIKLIPLQMRASIGGFSATGEYYTSTLFKTNDENLILFKDRKKITESTYNELKTKLTDIKYQREIFAVDSNNQLVRLTLKGAGLGGWFSFLKEGTGKPIYESNLIGKLIEISADEEIQKKGAVKYKSLTITGAKALTPEQMNSIKNLDSELATYLESKKNVSLSSDDEIILSTDEEKELKEMKKKAKALDHGDEITADDFFGDF